MIRAKWYRKSEEDALPMGRWYLDTVLGGDLYEPFRLRLPLPEGAFTAAIRRLTRLFEETLV
jgi:hypothetical protein